MKKSHCKIFCCGLHILLKYRPDQKNHMLKIVRFRNKIIFLQGSWQVLNSFTSVRSCNDVERAKLVQLDSCLDKRNHWKYL